MKILIKLIFVLANTLAFGQSPTVQTWNPANIVWQRTDADGTKWAVLEGDKDAPGKAFTYAFFLPAGHWEHHSGSLENSLRARNASSLTGDARLSTDRLAHESEETDLAHPLRASVPMRGDDFRRFAHPSARRIIIIQRI